MDPISSAYSRLTESTPSHDEVVRQLVEILRPLKGTGERYFDGPEEEDKDKVGPDEPIRTAVKHALKHLEVEGSGGCRLCQS